MDDNSIDTKHQKSRVRRDTLARLMALSEDERSEQSEKMLAILKDCPSWQSARTVLLYHPLRSEPNTSPLLDANPQESREIFLPRVAPSGLDIHRYCGPASLQRSPHGVLEPDPAVSPSAPLDQIELAIIPAVAFDPVSGLRLGRGGGYYDRLLADERFVATTIGIAFDLQLQSPLPAQPHDQPVQFVLTASGLTPTQAASAGTPGSA